MTGSHQFSGLRAAVPGKQDVRPANRIILRACDDAVTAVNELFMSPFELQEIFQIVDAEIRGGQNLALTWNCDAITVRAPLKQVQSRKADQQQQKYVLRSAELS